MSLESRKAEAQRLAEQLGVEAHRIINNCTMRAPGGRRIVGETEERWHFFDVPQNTAEAVTRVCVCISALNGSEITHVEGQCPYRLYDDRGWSPPPWKPDAPHPRTLNPPPGA